MCNSLNELSLPLPVTGQTVGRLIKNMVKAIIKTMLRSTIAHALKRHRARETENIRRKTELVLCVPNVTATTLRQIRSVDVLGLVKQIAISTPQK